MNFFEHQEAARRLSRRLVVLFALAVVAIVIAVNLVATFVYLGVF
jgi:preprotein translocase subunit Sec61beta